MPNSQSPRPVVLAILDGFGENSSPEYNAIAAARTPALDMLKAKFPHGLINASGPHVGLPEGQMGNSEVGHMNIGSGRVLMQELPRIDTAIRDGSLAKNPELVAFIQTLKASGGAAHLMGLLSPGGVHSHQHHMTVLAKIISEQGVKVWIHAFLDGRDTPPKSALDYIAQIKLEIAGHETIRFATVSGRYFAMDRDKRWDRIREAYDVITDQPGTNQLGKSWAETAEATVANAYAKSKSDEFIPPHMIGDYEGVLPQDGLLMTNFRADRAREILAALLDPDFKEFPRKYPANFSAALGMVEYSGELNRFMKTLFAPEPLHNILGEVLEARGLTQLHIAETEKYAHVTFFFNGGREEPFRGESRILVPSPKVATYDLKPEMSAFELTDRLVEAIDAGTFGFIVVNYANCDMVGHTGNLAAATRAVEAVDACLARVWQAVERKGGAMIVTADHGNAERMYDEDTRQPHTAHTLGLVPVILAAPGLADAKRVIPEGKLADIAPTVLKLMGLSPPPEMTGTALL
jgi:2,3-bisphosphoglycerate-independent phosphoglycerate mutase